MELPDESIHREGHRCTITTELTNIENRTEVIDATASVGIDKKKLRVLVLPVVPHL